VVGQEHIAGTLGKAVKSGRISHAYLFTGPRGTGKTSVARILAHEINGLPYDDSTHLDIIEIDAASNRRIDEIRDLRDKVNIAPTSAKFKVYIIDEVHMLTREAFNALLKTLEEPPAHVVFILATTEAHKLPETIISRTQRFTFKPVPADKVVAHLRFIAGQEGTKITDEALMLIARHGEGSFRDSISLLDQAAGQTGEVDTAFVQTMLGVPSQEVIDELAESLARHDAACVVQLLAQMQAQGYQAAKIAGQLGSMLRDRLLDAASGAPEDFALLQKLLNVPAAHEPGRYLEIILLEFALAANASRPAPNDAGQPKEVAHQKAADPAAERPAAAQADQIMPDVKPKNPAAGKPQAAAKPTAALDENLWPLVLAELKKNHNTLYGVARMAVPHVAGPDRLELGFRFAFHRKRVAEAKNQAIIARIITELSGQTPAIDCVEIEASARPPAPEPNPAAQTPAADPDIASISNIFGGGELLES